MRYQGLEPLEVGEPIVYIAVSGELVDLRDDFSLVGLELSMDSRIAKFSFQGAGVREGWIAELSLEGVTDLLSSGQGTGISENRMVDLADAGVFNFLSVASDAETETRAWITVSLGDVDLTFGATTIGLELARRDWIEHPRLDDRASVSNAKNFDQLQCVSVSVSYRESLVWLTTTSSAEQGVLTERQTGSAFIPESIAPRRFVPCSMTMARRTRFTDSQDDAVVLNFPK